jgi:2-keto-4-pentenoate hydratase/2-oxohepta-3-ene-1,7-dioic acid hydratase in catechol pathway
VHIGRFQDSDGRRLWALLSNDHTTVREIEGPMEAWAPRFSEGDSSGATLGSERPMSELTLVAPVDPGGRIFGTGVNYPTHMQDAGPREFKKPETMPGYIKLHSSVVDPGGVIRYPPGTQQFDYEIEIVLVVARPIVRGELRTASLLGYTIGNDASPRDVGRPTGGVDLYSMKAQDSTAPIGPWITTLDEFGGPGQPAFEFFLRVNDEERQRDNTKNMIWNLEEILQFVNERNQVHAGDMVFTGTTGGTGMLTGRFLQPGDRLHLEAEHIGVLSNTVGQKGTLEEW